MLQVPQYSFHSRPVMNGWSLEELTHFVDSKGHVGPGE